MIHTTTHSISRSQHRFMGKLFLFFLGIMLCAVDPVQAEQRTPMFYSQASQDQFVQFLLYDLIGKQDPGYYLEVGAATPTLVNNSYFFEANHGWKGVSIDITDRFAQAWSTKRKNSLLVEDATQADYKAILMPFPSVIDYLSIDIDRNYDLVLRRIPFEDYTFKIITIEHDFYRFGDNYRNKERLILSSLGYHLLCADVKYKEIIFEDWWIHPSAFPEQIFSQLLMLDLHGKRHEELIEILKHLKKE